MGPAYIENEDLGHTQLGSEGMARVGEEAIEDDEFDENAVLAEVLEGVADPTGEQNAIQVAKGQKLTGAEAAAQRRKLIYNPTINQQIRNRVNFKKSGGEITQQRWPPVKKFVPCNKHEARRDAQN